MGSNEKQKQRKNIYTLNLFQKIVHVTVEQTVYDIGVSWIMALEKYGEWERVALFSCGTSESLALQIKKLFNTFLQTSLFYNNRPSPSSIIEFGISKYKMIKKSVNIKEVNFNRIKIIITYRRMSPICD